MSLELLISEETNMAGRWGACLAGDLQTAIQATGSLPKVPNIFISLIQTGAPRN